MAGVGRYGLPDLPQDAWVKSQGEWYMVTSDGSVYGVSATDEVGKRGLRGTVYERLMRRYHLPKLEDVFKRGGIYMLHECGDDWVASAILPYSAFGEVSVPARGECPLTREELENVATLPPELHSRLVFRPEYLPHAYQGSATTVVLCAKDCYLVAAYAKKPQEYWART